MHEDKNLIMARRVAETVVQAGGKAYFVGGYVRDQLLKRENKDIDLEIHGISPEALMAVLDCLGQRTVMGASFGVFGLKHYDLDIAMPRSETENSRGKQDFCAYVDPFIGTERAALRRDLTMNALMQDVLTGEILDHFGGVEDLKQGVIRHVDDVTFAEDPLRVLRVAQFAARFQFRVAEETVELSRKLDLSALAKERVWGELEKALLKSPKPSVFFQVLRQMDQLHTWFPELEALISVEQDAQFHPEGNVWNHTMLVLDEAAKLRPQAKEPLCFMVAALCHDFGKAVTTAAKNGRIHAIGHEVDGVPIAGQFLHRMTREGKLRHYVQNMVENHMRPNVVAAQRSRVKSICKMLDQSVCPEDLLLLAKADHNGRTNASAYDQTEQFLREHLALYHDRMAQPYVMGADLIQAGFQPGKDFGEALEFAHKLRLAGVEKESALRQTVGYLRALQKKAAHDGNGS